MSRRPAAVDLLLDARHLRASGIGSYTHRLVHLAERWSAESGHSLAVWGDRADLDFTDGPVVHLPHGEAPMYSLREQRRSAQILREVRPAAFWTPHYPVPLLARVPTFATVHDLIHLNGRRDGGPDPLRRAYGRAMITAALRRCEAVFAVSEATASRLRALHGDAEVSVAKYGIDPRWFETTDPKPTSDPQEPPTVLYVGNVKPHKNLPRLIEAFASVAEQIPHRLVLAGGAAGAREEELGVPDALRSLGTRLARIGNVPFRTLRELVRAADVLVIPSLDEGVGLPPLEAMASGTAVIASRIPALMETCGEAALFVDPWSTADIASAIYQVCSDETLGRELEARGAAHVRARQSTVDELAPFRRIELTLASSR